MLHLLWLIPLMLALCGYRFHKKDLALKRFADAGLLERINLSVSRSRQWWKSIMAAGAVLLIVVSLTRPGWNPRPENIHRSGRDIAIVLDVSRSMLAEDLKPNRLERAKLAIGDLLDKLEGDRVALLAFAGGSVLKCPLTQDYGFFRTMMDDVGPDSVGRGGTLIGDALRKVMSEVFCDHLKRYKDVILITDGDDQDSYPTEAAKELGKQGVRLIAIGLGDENEGRRIPITNEKGERTFVRYDGKEVWSRLNADMLRKMVDSTPGGRYINVATGTFDLGAIYKNLVASAEKRELESQSIRRYQEKFQIFLGAALILLLLELVVSERRNGG